MIDKPVGENAVERLLEDIRLLSSDRHATIQTARRLIHARTNGASEKVMYGGLMFSDGEPFCGLFAYANHATLELSKGAFLADDRHMLEGSGKLRRHIKLYAADDVERKFVAEYISKAVELAQQTRKC